MFSQFNTATQFQATAITFGAARRWRSIRVRTMASPLRKAAKAQRYQDIELGYGAPDLSWYVQKMEQGIPTKPLLQYFR